MEVVAVEKDLEHLDLLDADTLLLFLVQGEEPITGLAGLVDWRLTGRLSRYVLRGWFTGVRGEKVLMPSHDRLPVCRLLGIGSGPRDSLDLDVIRTLAELAGEALHDAKVGSVACAPPGEPESPGDVKETVRALREGLSKRFNGRLILVGAAVS